MTIGLQILKRRRAVDQALAREFLDVPVANVSDCMSRMTAAGTRVRPMHGGGRMAGPALTIRTRPGDNLMLHYALEIAQPGDVLVVDGAGDLTNALIGAIMVGEAIQRRLGGWVIHGAIRDAGEIARLPMPVFASGVTHRGPYKDGPGEINVPIAIEGMVIEPGDLIIGDDDGVLCVPFDAAGALLKEARAKQILEARMIADIEAGTLDRSWAMETLKRLNCPIEE